MLAVLPANSPLAEMELSMLENNVKVLLVVLHANFCVVMEFLMPVKNVMPVLETLPPFPTHAEPTVNFLDVVMVFVTAKILPSVEPLKLVIVELMTDGAVAAKSSAVMESLMPERNVMMESTTLTLFPMLAETTVCCGTVVMVSWITWRNAITVPSTRTPLMPADPGVESPTAVMESSILDVVSNVMMETNWTVMVAIVDATRNVVTDVLILVKSAMMEPVTLMSSPAAAEANAFYPNAVMESLMLVKSVMMELEISMAPTLADLTVPSLNAVMVLLITCTVNSVIKVQETL